MNAKISKKVLPQKSIKNIVLSARLRAEKSIKNKSKFYQKSLTQAWDFFEFLEWKRLLFDAFSGSRLREISKTLREKTPVFDEFSSSRLREIFKLLKENTLIFDKSSSFKVWESDIEKGCSIYLKSYLPYKKRKR